MATVVVAAAASTAFSCSSLHLSTSLLVKSYLPRPLTLSRSLLQSRHITSEFNITFAPPKPKSKPSTTTTTTITNNPLPPVLPDVDSGPLFIPWIVRDDKGGFSLQSHPPARLLHEMAYATTMEKKKKPKKSVVKAVVTTKTMGEGTEAKQYSKAARRFYNKNFRDEPQRLSKVLAAAGVASRRSSEELVFEGQVTVNGSVCNTPQTRVDPSKDIIYVKGRRLSKKLPPKVYLALNKPKGYICSSGEKESKSVISLFDEYMKSWDKRNPGIPKPRLFTVGRLDVTTTGLIIVTNDGDFAQMLTHPSSNLSKEYIATIDGTVSKGNLLTISKGTVVEGVKCVPDAVELLPKQPDISRNRIRIEVHEGRNHEVRALVKNAGLTDTFKKGVNSSIFFMIYSLKRIRIGGFRLPSDLGLGKHIELRSSDLKTIANKKKEKSDPKALG